MKKKRYFLFIVALAALFLLSGCIPQNHDASDPAGFFWGIWHGLILTFTLIGRLFTDTTMIFAEYNTGWPYTLGFLIGLGSTGGGISLFGRN